MPLITATERSAIRIAHVVPIFELKRFQPIRILLDIPGRISSRLSEDRRYSARPGYPRGFSTITLFCALALPVLLAACGGGKADGPTAIAVPQCSGSSCPAQGQPLGTPVVAAKLCPDLLDYSVTYTGGSGSGEYVKMKFDSTKKQYQMTFVESSVPTSPGQVNNTRAGMTITGDYDNPSGALALPTAEQNRCAFVLKNGASADGTYSVAINPQDPPMLFVGQGIIGGGIPGATIQFNGIATSPGFLVGAVPSRTFDSYPFLGFSETVTDFTQVAGTYNELGFRVNPEGSFAQSADGSTMSGWAPFAIQASETLNADGTCTADSSPNSCAMTGTPWVQRSNPDGTPDNVFVSSSSPIDLSYPAVGVGVLQLLFSQSQAHGIMIVGKVANQLVPVVIRVGYAHTEADRRNIAGNALDDQLGISLLAPATTLAQSALKGGYIGANSASACGAVTTIGQSSGPIVYNGQPAYAAVGSCADGSASFNAGVNYGATLFQTPTAALLNPFTSSMSSNFSLDFTQTQPGLVNVTANKDLASGSTTIYKAGDTGVMVRVGPVYGLLMNGVNQPGLTNDPANYTGKVNPFLSIGAFVQ